MVQMFLEEVKREEEEGEDYLDNLSSEELLERLDRLENLQALQSSNENNVRTIDQSTENVDVQRALEKNPDISKERTNLLQGWSSVSGSLQGRIAVMRMKAKMVQDLEKACRACEESVGGYHDYLEVVLPPSVLLVETNKELVDGVVRAS